MSEYGINTQRFRVISDPTEALDAANDLRKPSLCNNIVFIFEEAEEIVVKAQVLAGGRGKGHFSSGLQGGVQLSRDPVRVAALTEQMLGHRIYTHQTGPDGLPVHRVMLAEAKDIVRETYLAILLDRTAGGPVFVGSPAGGMDIEAVAATNPEALHQLVVTRPDGPSKEELAAFALKLGFTETEGTLHAAVEQMARLWRLFCGVDALQVEINPLGVTSDGQVLCVDAKIVFDEHAAFRQQRLFSQASSQQAVDDDVREIEARKHGLSYIGLDGNIGCLVNGAGLAMATMDLIRMNGGSPANFLDVGGSATAEQILAAMRLLNSDPRVQAILVNIFGGIMRCDTIAAGLIKARDEGLLGSKPLVVRLAGTRAQEALDLLAQAGFNARLHADLDEAAEAAVESIRREDPQILATA